MARIQDEFHIRELIPQFPNQIIEALKVRFDFPVAKLPKDSNYVICGMGGSSQIDDFLKNYFANVGEGVHIYTSRNYVLPRETNKKSLVVVASYSGNTEESLACYKEARAKKHRMIAMANGGKLEALARRDGVPFVKLPDLPQPRYSISYQFGYHIKLLQKSGLIKNHDADIVRACKQANSFNYEAKGRALAKKFAPRYPLLYSDASYESILRIGSIKIYENSKTLCHWNVLPEMNHNEMNGFVNSKKQGKFIALLMLAPDINKRTQKRLSILSRIMKRYGAAVEVFYLDGSSHLARMISGLNLLDWVSFYLAQEHGVDPAPVEVVEAFKKQLG